MTNINQINESQQLMGTPDNKVTKNQTADAFQNVLNKAIETKESPEMEALQASALGEISSVEPPFTNFSTSVSTNTGKLLDMLETYSSKLEDPNIPLKNLAKELEQINTSADNLEKEARILSDSDTPLKEIVSRTVITAQTEYLKFQRGDYL